MRRGRWLASALITTLYALCLIGITFTVGGEILDHAEARASDSPPDRVFYQGFEIHIVGSLTVLTGLMVSWMAFSWAKVRRHGIPEKQAKKAGVELDKKDSLDRPPGFAGPKIRTRRKGLAPLVSFTLLSLFLLALAGTLIAAGLLTLDQAMGHEGRSHRRAVLFAGLTRWVGIPLWWAASGLFWMTWGRWFPLGQLEVIVEDDEQRFSESDLVWQSE